jgi:hypothetical protein
MSGCGAAARSPTSSRAWTLVIVGGLSSYRGSEPNVDVPFDCGLRPGYRVLIVGFRSIRHRLSTAWPSGSKSPYLLGSARRWPFAGTPGHVGEMCLTDSSSSADALQKKLHQPILTARHGLGSGAPQKIGAEDAIASGAAVAKLVELGYQTKPKRHRDSAVFFRAVSRARRRKISS